MPDSDIGRESYDRLRVLEARLSDVEKQVWTANVKLTEGLAPAREVTELKDRIHALERELIEVRTKTLRWEGGGSVIYVIITILGGVLGWVLSHTGLGR